jgi:pyridoxal phosphate enzyme (YggS family)
VNTPDSGEETATGQDAAVAGLRTRWSTVRAGIDEAAHRAGRDPARIRLLPVSKTVPVERLRYAVAAGMTEFAENKPQEIQKKAPALAGAPELPAVRWVAIGHLQTNKARIIAEYASEFQALDSVRLVETLQRRLELLADAGKDRTLDVMVQVNTSGEESKTGAAPEEVDAILGATAGCDRLRVRGFMTVATHTRETTEVRRCFAELRGIRDRARSSGIVDPEPLTELSMGMSGDYPLAVAEGATCVRVGTAIFGARPPA